MAVGNESKTGTETADGALRPSGTGLLWAPAVGVLLVSVLLAGSPADVVYVPPSWYPLVNALFFTTVSLLSSVLAAQGFTRNGSSTLVLLGAGIIAFGFGSVVGPALIAGGDLNAGITAHNLCALIGSSLHATSAILIWTSVPVRARRLPILASVYGATMVVSAAATVLAIYGVWPPFITAEGPAPIRTYVIVLGIGMYLVSGAAFSVRAFQRRAPFLHWYSIGLMLIGLGLSAVMLGGPGTAINWLGRLSQILGEAYILICLLRAVRNAEGQDTVGAIAESFSSVEAALQQTRARYESLFDAVSDGVVLHRADRGSHHRILECNATFTELVGYPPSDLEAVGLDDLVVAGRPTFPGIERLRVHGPLLFDTTLRRADGSEIPVEVHGRLLDDRGEAGTVLSVVRDVSVRQALQLQREDERSRLRQLFDETPIGLTLVEADGSVSLMNRSMSELWGDDRDAPRGIDEYAIYKAFHHGTDRPLAPTDWPAAQVISGAPDAEMLVDVPHVSGRTLVARFTARRIGGDNSEQDKILVVARDVTEPLQRARLTAALDRVRTMVTSTFDAERIEEELLTMGVEALECDGGLLLRRLSDHWTVQRSAGALAGIELRSTDLVAARPFRLAVEERHAVACPGTDCDMTTLPATLTAAAIHSLIAVPFIAQGTVVSLCLYCWRSAHEPSQPELEFANRVMGVSALALDNSESYQRERIIADTLQQAILTRPEQVPGLELAYLYRTASHEANVGGDFYDVFELDDGRVSVLVGDVSGKGVTAAKLTSLVRDGIRAYALTDDDPAEVVGRLNQLLYRSSEPDMFATLFFGVLDTGTLQLRYCSAGHTPAILAGCAAPPSLLYPTDPICGAFNDVTYTTRSLTMDAEDVLVLYTDGVTEARRGRELFGEERLAQLVESLVDLPIEDLPDEILATVETFSSRSLNDDVVILCLAPEGRPENVCAERTE